MLKKEKDSTVPSRELLSSRATRGVDRVVCPLFHKSAAQWSGEAGGLPGPEGGLP